MRFPRATLNKGGSAGGMQGNFKQVKQHQLHTCQLIYYEILEALMAG